MASSIPHLDTWPSLQTPSDRCHRFIWASPVHNCTPITLSGSLPFSAQGEHRFSSPRASLAVVRMPDRFLIGTGELSRLFAADIRHFLFLCLYPACSLCMTIVLLRRMLVLCLVGRQDCLLPYLLVLCLFFAVPASCICGSCLNFSSFGLSHIFEIIARNVCVFNVHCLLILYVTAANIKKGSVLFLRNSAYWIEDSSCPANHTLPCLA